MKEASLLYSEIVSMRARQLGGIVSQTMGAATSNRSSRIMSRRCRKAMNRVIPPSATRPPRDCVPRMATTVSGTDARNIHRNSHHSACRPNQIMSGRLISITVAYSFVPSMKLPGAPRARKAPPVRIVNNPPFTP